MNRNCDLQNAVAVTSIAEILEAEVTFSFGELVAESLLELRARSTHHRVKTDQPDSDLLSDSTHRVLLFHQWQSLSLSLESLGFVCRTKFDGVVFLFFFFFPFITFRVLDIRRISSRRENKGFVRGRECTWTEILKNKKGKLVQMQRTTAFKTIPLKIWKNKKEKNWLWSRHYFFPSGSPQYPCQKWIASTFNFASVFVFDKTIFDLFINA